MSETANRFIAIARTLATAAEAEQITSMQSPAVAEILGHHLARSLSVGNPDVIVVWDLMESAVLGHVVARELRADLVYAYSDQGSLGLGDGLQHDSKAVVLSYDWSEDPSLVALVRLVRNHGATITGIGSVVRAPDKAIPPGVTVFSLDEEPSSKKEKPRVDNND